MAVSAAVVGVTTAAVGTGISIWGSSESAEAQKRIAALEMEAEAQRMKAMELDARRQSLQAVRIQQRSNSQALTNATAQGAGGGSGLQGGYGQISGQTGFNLLGISQNLEIGRELFKINKKISQEKMNMADAGAMSALGSGITSLGNSIAGAGGSFSGWGGEATPMAGGYYGGSPSSNPNLNPSTYGNYA